MALRGPLSLCLESPVGIGEKLSWRVVAAPVLLWSDGHTREGQRGDTFLFSPPKAEERSRTMGLGILPLVMGVGGPLHPLDLSEFSNLIALRQKNHTHIGGDGGGVGEAEKRAGHRFLVPGVRPKHFFMSDNPHAVRSRRTT